MKEKIWLSSPHMSGGEQKYVQEAFATNWIAPLGPNVTNFENSLQNYLGEEAYVAALSSGTSAIHLALINLGVTNNDEVICQSFTFSATVNPIVYLGAIPVFIDSEKETWNMCPNLLETAIIDRLKKGRKPKAIIAVHLYGMPYNVNRIQEISVKYDIPVIEDSAEALGSKVNNQKCGTFGDYGILSFNGNKIITTSGGGALITSNLKEKEHTIFLATQAKDDAIHYEHTYIGYNYRMSNVLAGIGRGQLEVLENRVELRRKNYDFYVKELSHCFTFLDEPKGYFSNRWLTCMLTKSYKEREKIRLALLEHQVESRPLWKPMHLQPIFQKYPSYVNGVSENLFKKGLCLPSGSNLSNNDLILIKDIIKEF